MDFCLVEYRFVVVGEVDFFFPRTLLEEGTKFWKEIIYIVLYVLNTNDSKNIGLFSKSNIVLLLFLG